MDIFGLGLGDVLGMLKLIFMNKMTFVFALGLFLGWNLPQPAKAKQLQDWIVTAVKYVVDKIKNRNS